MLSSSFIKLILFSACAFAPVSRVFSNMTEHSVLSACFQLPVLLVTIARYFAIVFLLKKEKKVEE